jgi:transposase-like protein
MDWPRRPVERIPHQRFRPPHCPWPACTHHRGHDEFRYIRHGFYTRSGDGRRVPRFRCSACRRIFSQQTFACSYYAKRPRLGGVVAAMLVAGSAHRQIARTLGCAHSTVTRLSAKLGRHALLFHARALSRTGGIREPVSADHFESFVGSQIDALGIATAVGHRSWFVYVLDPAPHRRGGKITPAQQRRLDRRKGPAPPPRSRQARARDEAMFPVDQLHGLWRHSCAHHHRETIAFPRRINGAMERAYLLAVWRNFVKWRSERKADRTTPAVRLGLADRAWSWTRVLARRLFPGRVPVPEPWRRVYDREWDDEAAGPYVRHRLQNAY